MTPIFFGLCRVRRSDKDVRGVILFDSTSTVTLSPMNFSMDLLLFQFVMTSGCTLWKLCNDLCKLLVQWTGKIRWMLFLYPYGVSLGYHVYSLLLLSRFDSMCSLTSVLDIGTPQKKEYFLCAETPSAARAWVSTLQ